MKKTVKVDTVRGKLVVDEREWTTLLIHESSENTPDIETICTEMGIKVRYSNVHLEPHGDFEKMEVFVTVEGYNELLSVLKEKKLCSESGFWLGK